MSTADKVCLELTEYEPCRLDRSELPADVGEALYRSYGTRVSIEFPSPKTDGQWELTPLGWVGHIPLTEGFGVSISPKVPVGNLFRMLEYAYRLESLQFLAGLVGCKTLSEFYERLANVLSQRITDRSRKGLYRAYVPRQERLMHGRARLDVGTALRTPWIVALPWQFEEHTADLEDNQLLAWTLFAVARSGLCTERVLPTVRRAFRALSSAVEVVPVDSSACLCRSYHRLNADYEPMHALCRFFLDHTGPHHESGGQAALPFLVDMARLFELFVAEWMVKHLPAGYSLRAQERVRIGASDPVHFDVDLVLSAERTGRALCVLDTKYKRAAKPDPSDIAQVVAYAEALDCPEAVLIYPATQQSPFDGYVGKIRVRSLAFDLAGDLESAGELLLQGILAQAP